MKQANKALRRKPILRATLLILLVLGLPLFFFSEAFFSFPDSIALFAAKCIGKSLRHKRICFYLTLDEPAPIEWAKQREVYVRDALSVPGKFGRAREFNGRKGSYIETSFDWRWLGENFTLSLWVKMQPSHQNQAIWYTSFARLNTGFKLCDDGYMEFGVPSRDDYEKQYSIRYPFTKYGEWVNLLATVDSDRKQVCLYQNGKLMGETELGDFVLPPQNMEFGKSRWYISLEPFAGQLDEVAVWNVVLSDKKVRSVSKSKSSQLWRKAPFFKMLFCIAQELHSFSRNTVRFCDNFNLSVYKHTDKIRVLPSVTLHLSKNDRSRFVREHENSIRTGRCTHDGKKPRRINVCVGNVVKPAYLSLDPFPTTYPASRPSYLLDSPELSVFGHQRIRLIAPESLGNNLRPLITESEQGGTNGFCRVYLHGQSLGVYYFESLKQVGIPLRAELPIVESQKLFGNALACGAFFDIEKLQAQNEGKLYGIPADIIRQRTEEIAFFLSADVNHPWSMREWHRRIERFVAKNEGNEIIRSEALWGKNPAAMYITNDLDFARLRHFPGVFWSSSVPEIIDHRGKVCRPSGKEPVFVTLSAMVEGNTNLVAQHTFRCMPQNPPIPAMFVNTSSERFSRTERQPFVATFVDTTGAARWGGGFVRLRSGIKMRGNSSFYKGHKKPYSVKFDEPQQFFTNGIPIRNAQLISGYSDITRLRNRLCYDLFRSFADSPDRIRIAPNVEWCDLFINGAYLGVYELSSRIEDDIMSFVSEGEQVLLYEHGLFNDEAGIKAAQRLPRPRFEVRIQEITELKELIDKAGKEVFISRIGDLCDLDNLVDFTILLNVSGNFDGVVANYYVAKVDKPDAKFFFIPWDYDKTFYRTDERIVSSILIKRLMNESKTFKEMLHARWKELRGKQLSDDAIIERIDSLAAKVDFAMESEFWLYPELADADYNVRVEALKETALKRLQNCDQLFQ